MKIRQPAVAGTFYPGTKAAIVNLVSRILQKESVTIQRELSEKRIRGAIVPHAGYMFSAYQAVHFFEILKNSGRKFETFFIVNPNHSGYGAEIALDDNDYWETPYGRIEIDKEFYPHLGFAESPSAHKYEHSGEVMLPLLQHFLDHRFKIVPITLSKQNPQNAKTIADAIFKANKSLNKEICLIASSDFSHYIHPDEGRRLDRYVIDEILNLNTDELFRHIREKQISVCGFGPIMTLIEYSKLVSDCPVPHILKIGHSGEVIASDEVVDYVSILFYHGS